MALSDRAKDALLALLGRGVPRIDYYTTYRAKMVAQSSDNLTMDLKPDDPRLPSLQRVRVKWGIPGITAAVNPGAYVNLGWDNADPQQPYASLIESGNTATKIVIKGATVYLGAESGAEALIRRTEFNDHVHAAGSYAAPSGGGSVTGASAKTTAVTGTSHAKGA